MNLDTYGMSYVYDHFKWPHCTVQVRISSKSMSELKNSRSLTPGSGLRTVGSAPLLITLSSMP